ncbi:MAG: FAD-dependent monooxygenase [Proteobacteria bacterium]|nr:FAD-dependent monooxygenase [Pseudomonadota bacterium]
MDKTARILIAGAGPVGLAAALELARRGFRPEIIDNDGEPTPESRALAVNPRTLALLAPSGVTRRLLAKGHRVDGFLLMDGDEPLVRMDMGNASGPYPFLLSYPQSETEKLLIGALAERGIAVGWHTPLESLDTDEAGIIANGTPFDALIGADGSHSFVRKAMGIGFPGTSEQQEFGLADIRFKDWPHPWDKAVGMFRGDHVLAFIPMGEGFGRFISTRPDTLSVLPDGAKAGDVVWQSAFRISYRQAETYQKGNVFLAGDAAHIHSPIGGRGMNLGIEDACWLAWMLAEGRSDGYTEARHPVGAQVLRMTSIPTGFLASKARWRKLFLHLVLSPLLGAAFVQRRVIPALLGLNSPAAPWLAPNGRLG